MEILDPLIWGTGSVVLMMCGLVALFLLIGGLVHIVFTQVERAIRGENLPMPREPQTIHIDTGLFWRAVHHALTGYPSPWPESEKAKPKHADVDIPPDVPPGDTILYIGDDGELVTTPGEGRKRVR